MPEWVLWMIAAGALAAGEVLTLGFFLGAISLAAVLAALVALVGAGIELQILAFIAGSAASLAFVRPIARKHLRTPATARTGTAALVGARAVVVERVDADGGTVKIGGEMWSARSYDEDRVIEPGTRVDVLKIEGATALVSE
jgi:membrane protein implicated in regulation of membrane protease activity